LANTDISVKSIYQPIYQSVLNIESNFLAMRYASVVTANVLLIFSISIQLNLFFHHRTWVQQNVKAGICSPGSA